MVINKKVRTVILRIELTPEQYKTLKEISEKDFRRPNDYLKKLITEHLESKK